MSAIPHRPSSASLAIPRRRRRCRTSRTRSPKARLALSHALMMVGVFATLSGGGCQTPPPRIEFTSLPPGWTHEDADAGGRPTSMLPPGWTPSLTPTIARADENGRVVPISLYYATNPEEPALLYINMATPGEMHGWKLVRLPNLQSAAESNDTAPGTVYRRVTP